MSLYFKWQMRERAMASSGSSSHGALPRPEGAPAPRDQELSSSAPNPARARPAGRPCARLGAPLVLAAVALWLGCGETPPGAFGGLDTPVSLAMHPASGNLFIASQGRNDLKVYNVPSGQFLVGPAALFPLSIPTVRSPILAAAGERFVFVVSGASAEIGFVDTVRPPGALGPRSVDGPDGFPLTLAVDTVPTAGLALSSPFGYADDGDLSDHLLLAGLSPEGEGGSLLLARPPHLVEGADEALPAVVAQVALPGIAPKGVAVEPGAALLEVESQATTDCRNVAIADARLAPGHTPGVWFSTLRIEADGAASLVPPEEGRRIELKIPVTLADGSLEERTAGARAVAFAPAVQSPGLDEAVEADPCALRSGRLFVVLDLDYCAGAASCPNVAVYDLGGEGELGTLATDATTGGPAAYVLPGAQLDVVAMEGPFTIPDAFNPSELDPTTGEAAPAEDVSVLVLFSSSDGALTYMAGGFGSALSGPDERDEPDPVYLLSSTRAGPGLSVPLRRIDAHAAAGAAAPSIEVPQGARPRSERWIAGFEAPLPGMDAVGTRDTLRGDELSLSENAGTSFLTPVEVRASSDPLRADRLVPKALGGISCDGYPIRSVSEDGRSIQVERAAAGMSNPAGCDAPHLSMAILPPKAEPWILEGDVTGFVGRAANDPGAVLQVFAGDRLLFTFETPGGELERGAIWQWTMTSGFRFLRADPEGAGLMAASLATLQLESEERPNWRVFVAYSGADLLMQLNPLLPEFRRLRFLQ